MFAEGSLKLTYLTNCGVMIQHGKTKLLVDGLFSGRQPYDSMDPKMEQGILDGEGDYEGIGYLLFTHCHNDHYNGSKILKFLGNHPGTTLVVPKGARLDQDRLARTHAKVITMGEERGRVKRVDFGDFQMEYMKTEHMIYQYPNHYCINILTEESNVLLTADMSPDDLSLLENFTRKPHSVVFMNQFFLWHKKWIRGLLDLEFSRVFFYHLPSDRCDRKEYGRRGVIYWKRYGEFFPNGRLVGYEEEK